ncbi:hypothetical protein CEXT_158871 [Caerostris extrusa]|uniref:Uncharacterized protein n=1 Tax=Caerostris extrusa TaxID=172846 RepID=A0AAV4SYK1_CAEEX|nr:hypothetical protein CEXT_158871 [Caerostris extrusa]
MLALNFLQDHQHLLANIGKAVSSFSNRHYHTRKHLHGLHSFLISTINVASTIDHFPSQAKQERHQTTKQTESDILTEHRNLQQRRGRIMVRTVNFHSLML